MCPTQSALRWPCAPGSCLQWHHRARDTTMHMFQEVRSAARAPQSATLVFAWNDKIHETNKNISGVLLTARRSGSARTAVTRARCHVSRADTITTGNNKNNNTHEKKQQHDNKFRRWGRFLVADENPNELLLDRLTGMLIRRLLRFLGFLLARSMLDSITVLPIFPRGQAKTQKQKTKHNSNKERRCEFCE